MAVDQLAWVNDLHLANGTAIKTSKDELGPLDEVNTPPDTQEHLSGPPTENTTVLVTE